MSDAELLASTLVTALIFAPLLAALLGWLIPRPRLLGAVAITLAAGLLIAMVPLSMTAIAGDGLRIAFGAHRAPLGIELAVDGLSLLMLWLTQILAFAVNVYLLGWSQGGDERAMLLFRVVWLLLWGALNGLFLSADLFNLYVMLEITTIAGVALVAAAGGAGALTAALRYLQFALVGSIFYLLGVALTYGHSGTLALALLEGAGQSDAVTLAALAMMTLGLLIKAALFPVHGWLPPAHAGAPAPASAVLSALVVQAAAYLLLRLWSGAFGESWPPLLAQSMGALGLAGIVYASIQALRQQRLKQIIAYSTVAQLGYLLLLMPLAGVLAWQGVLYHALAHGLAKAAMFLAAGNVTRALGNDRLENLAGMDRVLSGNLLVIGIAGISLAGLPPSGGFIGKWWLIWAALEAGQWWWALGIATGGFLAAAYVFRALRYGMVTSEPAAGPANHHARSLPRSMIWPPYLLAFATLAMGFAGDLLAPLMGLALPQRIDA